MGCYKWRSFFRYMKIFIEIFVGDMKIFMDICRNTTLFYLKHSKDSGDIIFESYLISGSTS